jgi:hypothetical protein
LGHGEVSFSSTARIVRQLWRCQSKIERLQPLRETGIDTNNVAPVRYCTASANTIEIWGPAAFIGAVLHD